MSKKITVDLYADWIEDLRSELLGFGYAPSALASDEKVPQIFFNLQKRLIPVLPRQVLKAAEFTCPPELQTGLSMIEQKISRGADLLPHLSTKLRKPNYSDPLLNHWGIHHLHLGSAMQASGFVDRTGPLLFARFDHQNAYLLSVLPHGAWSRQDFVRVLHKNWPESIRPYRLNGVVSLAVQYSDEDVAKLRSVQVNTMVEVEPGVVYAPMGGGVTASTSGVAVEVVMQIDRYRKLLRDRQKLLEAQFEVVQAAATQQGITLPENPTFKLAFTDDHVCVIEQSTKLVVSLGGLP